MARNEYINPEDVIVSTNDGVRSARLAYTVSFGADLFAFQSKKPVLFETVDLGAFKEHWHRIWVKAREAARKHETDEFLRRTYPMIIAEKQSWDDFLATGNQPSITAWRKTTH